MLDEYQGTILIVSHDRDFMDKVATSLLYMKGDGTIIEHIGSYSELIAKLENKPVKEVKKSKPTPAPEPESSKTKAISRLSYKDKRLNEILPDEIAALEQKIAAIEQTLSEDVELYTRNPQEFDRLTAELQECQLDKDEKETAWLELQMKIEALQSGE